MVHNKWDDNGQWHNGALKEKTTKVEDIMMPGKLKEKDREHNSE